MILIIKGFIIGIGKIMPGVSGAMIAITLKEYNKIIQSIADLKKDIYNNTKYLSKIGLGIILAIITMSKIIVKCINNHYFPTILLFTGLIISGIPEIIKETTTQKKDIMIATAIIMIVYMIIKIIRPQDCNTSTYSIIEFIKLIGIGIIDAISSIIPGISGTAILMYLGYYNKIINTFATITKTTHLKSNIYILIPFIIGFIIGTMLISKIIDKIINKYPNTINTMVIIFMTFTIITLLSNAIKLKPQPLDILLGIVLFLCTIIISLKMHYRSNKM